MIQAIETKYNGYRFRSRLEARWAVFFDAMSIAWSYEVEGLQIKHHGMEPINYLPDFWLIDWGLFVEIKPTYKVEKADMFKMTGMVAHSDNQIDVLLLRGPDPGQYLGDLFFSTNFVPDARFALISGLQWSECPLCNSPGLYQIMTDDESKKGTKDRIRCLNEKCVAYENAVKLKRRMNWITPRVESAIVDARSARFEHGEAPKVPRGKPKRVMTSTDA